MKGDGGGDAMAQFGNRAASGEFTAKAGLLARRSGWAF
jgi:hypothetical protein